MTRSESIRRLVQLGLDVSKAADEAEDRNDFTTRCQLAVARARGVTIAELMAAEAEGQGPSRGRRTPKL